VTPLDASAVAALLDEIGDRLELTGEAVFKVRAYRGAADLLRELREPLAELVASRRLTKLPGVGEAIAEKISSLHKKGTHPTLERLREEVPEGLLQIFRIPGLGPKKVLQLREVLGIEDLDALERACEANKLVTIKGFTPKLQAKVHEGLAFVRASAVRMLLIEADAHLFPHLQQLAAAPGVMAVSAAGETRRRCETVSEPVLVAAVKPGASLPEPPGGSGRVRRVVCTPEQFGAVLYWETVPDELRARAQKAAERKGLSFTAAGLTKNGAPVPVPAEADFLKALGLPDIAPECREPEAGDGKPAAELIQPAQVRGILHSHTTYSDGSSSLAEMCEATRALGLEYYGVCDHSQTAAYARGLKEDRIRQQHAEIDTLNAQYRAKGIAFRVFKGIESDILEAGALDYPPDVLARFDFIVASVHSRFDLDEAKQTERIVNAVANPFTTILGHCTGRLLLRRTGYKVDLERALAACGQYGVAVEINAHLVRLDLDWRWHRRAKELGCRLSINPDAHTIPELAHFSYGVDVARKGGLAAADNLTCLGAEELARYFEARKARR